MSGPEMKLLHVYSQPWEHTEARIVGNAAGLRALQTALALLFEGFRNETFTEELYATDGEGYQVQLVLMPDDWHAPEWALKPPHYCDRGYDDDTHR